MFPESRLTRKTPASYADGVYMMAGQNRPSSRTLSEALMKGEDGKPSAKNRTAMLAFFGKYSHLVLKSIFANFIHNCHGVDAVWGWLLGILLWNTDILWSSHIEMLIKGQIDTVKGLTS